MEIKIIKNPSPGTTEILRGRIHSKKIPTPEIVDTIGLVQGRMIEMIVAADIAEKAVGVVVEDISGSCPQNMILLAIFGDTAAVESALNQIREKFSNGTYDFKGFDE